MLMSSVHYVIREGGEDGVALSTQGLGFEGIGIGFVDKNALITVRQYTR